LKEVSCEEFCPSRSQTQISSLPERAELKTIFVPSGENWGSTSDWVEAMNLEGAILLSDEFGPGIRHMFETIASRA
jgi:hypothetical protein